MLHFLKYHLKLVEQIFLAIIVALIGYALYIGNAWGVLYFIVLGVWLLQLARYRFVRDVWKEVAEEHLALNGKLLEELAVYEKAKKTKAKPKAKKETKANGSQVKHTSKSGRTASGKSKATNAKGNRPANISKRKPSTKKASSKA